ncbi:MAG: ArsR family transcriptional regulator [Candidatus Heimdallarchaeota archaeon]|nr:ArsR family transcriptional regulator [Candidatus Heimdallarchaeota archaeon]
MDPDFEYLDRLRNKSRKQMLIAVYEGPKHYAELSDLTGLKPGSIYHHLKVLEPLVIKEGQGLYNITDQGRQLVERQLLVEVSLQKPKIDPITRMDGMMEEIWIGKLNRILGVFILFVIILLGFQGVALAGSAIYAVNSWVIIIFDLLGFGLGWMVLYILEIITPRKLYSEPSFPLMIRLISMFPGAVVGLGLYLSFLAGVIPTDVAYPIIFSLTTSLGLLLAASGEVYLRGQSWSNALRFASIPTVLDILLGVFILLSI